MLVGFWVELITLPFSASFGSLWHEPLYAYYPKSILLWCGPHFKYHVFIPSFFLFFFPFFLGNSKMGPYFYIDSTFLISFFDTSIVVLPTSSRMLNAILDWKSNWFIMLVLKSYNFIDILYNKMLIFGVPYIDTSEGV